MDNNDVLKKIRYALDLKDPEMVACFRNMSAEMSRDWLSRFFRTEGETDYLPLSDEQLLLFLDGLIIARRGRKE